MGSNSKWSSCKETVDYIKLTEFKTPEKMRYGRFKEYEENIKIINQEVTIRHHAGSTQIQCDIIKWWDLVYAYLMSRCLSSCSNNKFSAILVDPPWDNTGCKLGYPTLKDEMWMSNINFGSLVDNGLVFMFVTASKDTAAIRYMESQGFTKSDRITWVKGSKSGELLRRAGYYLWHSEEVCLIFKKKQHGILDKYFMVPRTSGNVILSQPTGKISQKPFQIYDVIEEMVPLGPKLEIFGRAHSQRQGCITIGNESITYLEKDRKSNLNS